MQFKMFLPSFVGGPFEGLGPGQPGAAWHVQEDSRSVPEMECFAKTQ